MFHCVYSSATYHTKQHMPMSRTTIPIITALANTIAIDNPEKEWISELLE